MLPVSQSFRRLLPMSHSTARLLCLCSWTLRTWCVLKHCSAQQQSSTHHSYPVMPVSQSDSQHAPTACLECLRTNICRCVMMPMLWPEPYSLPLAEPQACAPQCLTWSTTSLAPTSGKKDAELRYISCARLESLGGRPPLRCCLLPGNCSFHCRAGCKASRVDSRYRWRPVARRARGERGV